MKPRVLLVDDDPNIRLIARAALARAGFDVVEAETGAAALIDAAGGSFDLIVLDWMLPDADGPHVCEKLKASPSTASIPIIFLTGRRDAADVARVASLGARGSIPKPFNPLTLGDEIRALWNPDRPGGGR